MHSVKITDCEPKNIVIVTSLYSLDSTLFRAVTIESTFGEGNNTESEG